MLVVSALTVLIQVERLVGEIGGILRILHLDTLRYTAIFVQVHLCTG